MNDVTYEASYDAPASEGVGDPYAGAYDTTEGRVYTVTGQDWDTVLAPEEGRKERIVVNMGPQHPSTHGVLRIILELDGETVTEARCGIGYLHTGIEKNLEYRTWTQGVAFVTRMDYLACMANEAGYVLAVEKLLGIEQDVPERAQLIRVVALELQRISSHLVALATGGFEMGALTAMTNGFRDREEILRLIEMMSGLRMNNAYLRPGGVAQDMPEGGIAQIRAVLKKLPKQLDGVPTMLVDNGVWKDRTSGIGYLDLAGCMALGVTGPVLRATGLPYDVRKAMPYFGYERFDFDVPTETTCDVYGRFLIRIEEINQSLRILAQACDLLEKTPGPVMVADKKIAWPAQLSIGSDGQGNSLDHIRHIMGESMEALIHHFKLVTEGFSVPAGQVHSWTEAPRGALGVHAVSDGGTRPYRVHFRDPSFNNLQATAAMCEGGQVADVIGAVASIDPVMGGVDR
ncbi:MAG TPA: NADH-quinone oxidoreductase subunit D [Candidatus Nanopelagicales bacterium]|nr:NADH-quinone oxidoreductase subunit D [Candidatus Nanopelagicales bacterium]